jgi:hypothetical protein
VKIAAGFVEGLDRIADTLFALLLPGGAILAATRLAEIMSFDPGSINSAQAVPEWSRPRSDGRPGAQ